TGLATLIEGLIAKYSRQNISISFPSLRAETINPQWLNALGKGRKTGFTIAPEVGTERLRRIINKSLTEMEIIETCQQVFSAGWRNIKLYFMLGLPTETQEDLEGIVALAKKIFFLGKDAITRPEVTISVSSFIPKPHTPFQWLPMIDAEEIRFRQRYLLSLLKKSRITFKWQAPEMSILEGVMARGDRRLAQVIEEAFQNGARFDGWTELFNFPVWERALQKMGLPMDFYLSPFDKTDILPWDHIETGVTKDFLWQELTNAKMGKETPDCRWEMCNQCGVCDFQSVYPRIQSGSDQKHQTITSDSEKDVEEKVTKVRLNFSKTNEARFLSHLEMARAFARAARRASLPLRYSQGFHPQPRISFGPALAVGLESLDELVDIELTGGISVETVIASLNRELPQGIRILTGKEIPLQTPAISDTVREISYAISIHSSAIVSKYSLEEIKRIFSEFLSKRNLLLSRQHKGKTQSIDIRDAIKELIFSDPKTIFFTLVVPQAQGLRPHELMGTILGIPEEDLKTLLICKIRMKLRE
ncbi:MAG TPA: TIGR03936 family radical SAM-associated protein, partial [Thermodesulfobacteriota bacterium]|nr:TIGR03936 family radical SAM-associated protein [Thermodesulfobacteriota bacterium]